MRHRIGWLVAISTLIGVVSVRAEVPQSICVQGFLESAADGAPVNGPVTFKVCLYDAAEGGTQVWPPGDGCFEVLDVPVENGLFALVFGDSDIGPEDFAGPRWLEICTVVGGVMSPRVELRTAPYAFRTGRSQRVDFVDNPELTDHVELGSSTAGQPGLLDLFNDCGTIAAQIRRHPGNESGVIELFRTNGELGLSFEADGGDGALIHVRGTPSTTNTVSIVGGAGDGGSIHLNNGQLPNQETVTLDGNGPANAGMLTLKNSTGSPTIIANADSGPGAPEINLYPPGQSVTVQIGARSGFPDGGGVMALFKSQGPATVQLRAGTPDEGGRIGLFNGQNTNQETITLDGGSGRIGLGTTNPQAKLHIGGTPGTDGVVFPDGSLQTTAAPGGGALIGEVKMWAGPIASIPSGWLFCDGSAVSRTTYASLFNVIGTIYGSGDGSTTFNLPDSRDRSPMGARQDDGGIPKTNVTGALTQTGGASTHTLSVEEIPTHAHVEQFLDVDSGDPYTVREAQVIPSGYQPGSLETITQGGPDSADTLGPLMTGTTGGGQPHNTLHPYFAITFIIYGGVP